MVILLFNLDVFNVRNIQQTRANLSYFLSEILCVLEKKHVNIRVSFKLMYYLLSK